MEAAGERTQAPISDTSLWFGVGTGVAVWMLHLMATYALVAMVCGRGWLDFNVLGMSGLRFTLLMVTLLGMGLITLAALTSYRNWQKLRQEESGTTSHKRYVFMTFSGVMLNILFGALVIIPLIPGFMLPPCQ